MEKDSDVQSHINKCITQLLSVEVNVDKED